MLAHGILDRTILFECFKVGSIRKKIFNSKSKIIIKKNKKINTRLNIYRLTQKIFEKIKLESC